MYTKIFSSIFESSVWMESNSTRLVWFTLLIAMDQDGYAHFAGIKNLAHKANVGVPEAEEAVRIFEGADSSSTNPNNGGKRIEKVPGGWMVLNSAYYRDISKAKDQREKTKERVAKHRKNKSCNALHSVTSSVTDVTCNGMKQLVTTSETDTNTDTNTNKDIKNTVNTVRPALLNRIMCRNDFDKLSETESNAFVDLVKRPDLLAEIDIIGKYYDSARADNFGYLRKSMIALLSHWQEELDKARAWSPPKKKEDYYSYLDDQTPVRQAALKASNARCAENYEKMKEKARKDQEADRAKALAIARGEQDPDDHVPYPPLEERQ